MKPEEFTKDFWSNNFKKYTTEPSEKGFDFNFVGMMKDCSEAYFQQRINAITDEEIEDFKDIQPYYGNCTTEYLEGIEIGAKYVKNKLLNQ